MSKPYNILIQANSAFSLPISVVNVSASIQTPFDLTGYTTRASIKRDYNDTKTWATMSLNNIPNSSGSLDLGMTAAQTKDIAAGSYVYDVLLVSGSVQTRIMYGVASVTPYVTL